MGQSDQELIVSISQENAEALSEFYDRHSRLIYGALLRLLGDTDDAEDMLQDVFVQVWRKASTYKPELGSPKNWLVRIAHNRAINKIRSNRLRAKGAEITDEDISVTSNAQLIDDSLLPAMISSERMQMINEAMKDLPKDQAQLISMAFLEGYSHSEISETTGMPLGTVKSKIRNGLLALRGSLSFLKSEFSGQNI